LRGSQIERSAPEHPIVLLTYNEDSEILKSELSIGNKTRKVTVISKTGCHICENVIGDLQSLSGKYRFELVVLDILKDKELFDEYWLKIPVIRLDGKDVLECEQIAFPKDRMERLEAVLS